MSNNKSIYSVLKYLLPFIISFLGYFLTTDHFINLYGLEIRYLGIIILLVGLCVIFFVYNKLPSFLEPEWQDQLEEIYILSKSGLCIYYEAFKDKADYFDKNLASGAMMTVKMLLDQFDSDEKKVISTIKKKGKVVKMYSGEYIMVIVISIEDLHLIDYSLKKFVTKFEYIYNSILKDWRGDLDIFTPVSDIIKEIFRK